MTTTSRTIKALLATALLSATAGAAGASAAVTPVTACGSDARNGSWERSGSTLIATTPSCAPSLWVRNVVSSRKKARVKRGTHGGLRFVAPNGTRITALHANWNGSQQYWRSERASHWKLGIWDGEQWVFGGERHLSHFAGPGYQHIDVTGLSTSVLAVRLLCSTKSRGCPRNKVYARFDMRDITVDLDDFLAPDFVAPHGSMWNMSNGDIASSTGWLSGETSVAFTARDNMGVQRTAILVDGEQVTDPAYACDHNLRLPCPASVDDAFAAPAGRLADGVHTITIRAQDAAGNVTAASRQFKIDSADPQQPTGLELEGLDPSVVRNVNSFTVDWVDPQQDAGSALLPGQMQICQAPGGAVDPSFCVTRSLAAMDPTVSLRVPGTGDWRMRVRRDDAAGHQGDWSSYSPLLRYDPSAP
jgi:hypothetical protein